MEKLDSFTLNLPTNDEVIHVNQDPPGKQASSVQTIGDLRIYEKELEDGSRAVGFCNFGFEKLSLVYNDFKKLGRTGHQTVRGLWRQKGTGPLTVKSGQLSLNVPAHGVLLYKFSPAR